MKKLLIAVGVLILTQAYCVAPFYNKAFAWVLFVVLLLYGLYFIYDAMQTEK